MITIEKVISLWSGGIDSTVMTYYLSAGTLVPPAQYVVQPLHVLIRNGSGKDYREREAIDSIYALMYDKYPNVLQSIRIKQKIPPSDDRNVVLIKLAKTLFPEQTKFAIGGYVTDNRFPEDNDYAALSTKAGVMVLTFDFFNIRTKEEIFKLGMDLLGQQVMAKTWSCQLWYKKQCFERNSRGQCFSCKRVVFLRNKYFVVSNYA